MTADQDAFPSTQLVLRIYLALALVIALAAAVVVLFGAPALGFIGLGLTFVTFAVLLAFTAGG